MLSPRTTQILQAVIQDFIVTGEPVSSRKLVKKHDFTVKDATVRNTLNDLIRAGFLYQPHISSGRVPTDKGYRFLVDRLMEDIKPDFHFQFKRAAVDLEEELLKGEFEDFITDFSDELDTLGVGYDKEEETVYKRGLDELIGQLVSGYQIRDPEELYEVVKDFEMIDERMEDLLNFTRSGGEPKVFIGRSPITRSPQLSVISARYYTDHEEFLLAAVGPKRMNYKRNINFFKKLQSTIQK